MTTLQSELLNVLNIPANETEKVSKTAEWNEEQQRKVVLAIKYAGIKFGWEDDPRHLEMEVFENFEDHGDLDLKEGTVAGKKLFYRIL